MSSTNKQFLKPVARKKKQVKVEELESYFFKNYGYLEIQAVEKVLVIVLYSPHTWLSRGDPIITFFAMLVGT